MTALQSFSDENWPHIYHQSLSCIDEALTNLSKEVYNGSTKSIIVLVFPFLIHCLLLAWNFKNLHDGNVSLFTFFYVVAQYFCKWRFLYLGAQYEYGWKSLNRQRLIWHHRHQVRNIFLDKLQEYRFWPILLSYSKTSQTWEYIYFFFVLWFQPS